MNTYKALFVKIFIITFVVISGAIAVSSVSAQGKADSHIPVCPGPANKGTTRCHARVVIDRDGLPKVSVVPAGYGPAQFHGAYSLATISASPKTIAIIDAYNHPNIKSDLDTYNSTFGLPFFPNCSSSVTTSCFQKVDQRGGTNYPKTNAGWALEIALDVETAHGICQNCKILLVEADSNSYANLMIAVDRAVSMGANVISNSYGSGEFSGETSFDSHFNHAGIAITFSSGDSGYGAEYPASSPYVTAVGGTTLNLSAGNTWGSETVWNGAGSGCSVYETVKPAGQPTLPGCANRIVADVAADADPNTGAAVYSSVRIQGRKGWFKVGGTSLASPIIAGTYALGDTIASDIQANTIPYSSSNASNLHDVTSGNTINCDGTSLCTGVTGFDGPTGLGTPIGTGAF